MEKIIVDVAILLINGMASIILGMLLATLKRLEKKQDALSEIVENIKIQVVGEYQTRDEHDRNCTLPHVAADVSRLQAKVERALTLLSMFGSRDKDDSQG